MWINESKVLLDYRVGAKQNHCTVYKITSLSTNLTKCETGISLPCVIVLYVNTELLCHENLII